MLAEITTGVVTRGDGAVGGARATRLGALVTAKGQGDFTEAALRARMFDLVTPVAGVAPGTVLSTTPPLTLWNPPSSGTLVAVLKSYLGYISGTLGGGSVVYAVVPAQMTVPTTGTELVPQCSLVGAPRGVARGFTGSTLVAIPTLLRPAYVLGAFAAATAVAPDPALDLVHGAIVLPPGTCLCLQGVAAAGTTPLMLLSLAYEELPL
ncbi:MAG: hypothetical protein JZU52_12705 [Lamprocystis purpurea]|jgi:hypothetical protein|uniref:hypothetical protein n=1 Tax=Lamprocystis purpurea TaxID=61598 RepID=UPI000364B27C|nr:hypothetical protein [Lamprocystis purpurea]MBV5274456.1 hypothetical protein [Lamprocystis purpurea]